MDREMKGILYGVGVGPGDPELLSLKAVRVIKESDLIAVPGKTPAESYAYEIALKAVPEIGSKEVIPLKWTMTKDPADYKPAGAEQVAAMMRRNTVDP